MATPGGPYKELWRFPCGGAIISVAATPNCSLISASSVDCSLYLIHGDGTAAWERPAKLDSEAWATAISADGGLIAAGTASKNPADGTVYVFDRRKELIWSETIGAPVWGVSLSADGTYLAASSWNNRVYRFIKKSESYELECERELPSGYGLYGISLSDDGRACIVSSYNTGLFVLDDNWAIQSHVELATGLYKVDVASNTGTIVAGLRDGAALLVYAQNNGHRGKSVTIPRLTSRPICGVAISNDGKLLGLGSFDGRLYMVSSKGDCLWTYETSGEVWSVAMSGDGGLVVMGTGDQSVRLLLNHCTSAAITEIHAAEAAPERWNNDKCWPEVELMLDTLLDLYLKYGLIKYGVDKLRGLKPSPPAYLIRDYLKRFLEADIAANPMHYYSHYELGEVLYEAKCFDQAAQHYQLASNEPKYRSRALEGAARCFSTMKLFTASFSCFRRAREQHLDSDAKRVLYNLARSYEDNGDWQGAARHYELLISWDTQYRNTWSRLQTVTMLAQNRSTNLVVPKVDYTGLTTSYQSSLLGPDTPKTYEVDDVLVPIISARSSEVRVEPAMRKQMACIISELAADETFMRGITKAGLGYTTEMYLKYEYLLPEDELKKFLETANTLNIIEGESVSTALDLGTATGRYPFLLKGRGVEAFGVDREYQGVAYASKKRNNLDSPQFLIGDVQGLPIKGEMFDLVTCMMGTFAHVPRQQQGNAINEIVRILRPGGLAVISTWDAECNHLAFLSMYSETQKESIRQHSPRQSELRALFTQYGLDHVAFVPFCLLPQAIVYDLGLQKLDISGLRMAVDIDLAVRGTFPDRHGEMYIGVGRKPL